MARNGQLSAFKRTKMGAMPGDLPRFYKIAMLEKGYCPGYGNMPDNYRQAKTFKRIIVDRAKSRLRMKPIPMEVE